MNFKNIQLFSRVGDAKKMLDSGADLILLDESELEKYTQNAVEILDIYNEGNTRIGAASRKAYIKLGLITHAVHAFIFNEKGEVYLQKRAPNKDTYPGYYAPSVAGHVGLGEASNISAAREMEEEIGLKIPLTFVGSFKCFQPENIVNQFYDFYIGFSSQPIRLDVKEAEAGGFYSWSRVMNELDHTNFVPALKKELELFGPQIQAEIMKRNI